MFTLFGKMLANNFQNSGRLPEYHSSLSEISKNGYFLQIIPPPKLSSFRKSQSFAGVLENPRKLQKVSLCCRHLPDTLSVSNV